MKEAVNIKGAVDIRRAGISAEGGIPEERRL